MVETQYEYLPGDETHYGTGASTNLVKKITQNGMNFEYAYQDEYDNRVIVAFYSDIVSCYACYTAESELFLISEDKTRLCLGKSAQEMQHFIGEFHGTLDLNEDSFPFYITQDARIAYFVFDRGVVKQIYSIDILTGNIQNISGMQ